MNKKRWLSIAAGAVLLYLTYISVLLYFSESVLLWADAQKPGLLEPREYGAGYFLPSVMCALFILALWLLGCLRTYSLFESAPAFALCVVWLLASSYRIGDGFSAYALRSFTGGGALAFAFTCFNVIHGLVLRIKVKRRPDVSIKKVWILLTYVAVMYALDNLTFALAPSAIRSADRILGIAYMYYARIGYPLIVGIIGALPFVGRKGQSGRMGTVLLIVTGLCLFINVFPLSLISPGASSVINEIRDGYLFGGMRARLWVYMSGALLCLGFGAIINRTKEIRQPNDAV